MSKSSINDFWALLYEIHSFKYPSSLVLTFLPRIWFVFQCLQEYSPSCGPKFLANSQENAQLQKKYLGALKTISFLLTQLKVRSIMTIKKKKYSKDKTFWAAVPTLVKRPYAPKKITIIKVIALRVINQRCRTIQSIKTFR